MEGFEMYTKIAGVSFEGRQVMISKLTKEDKVSLVHEPVKTYPHAIAVYSKEGQIGFIKDTLAKELYSSLKEGNQFAAKIQQITGGGDRHYGVNIKIMRVI